MIPVSLFGLILALAPALPEDAVIREVIALVERTHVDRLQATPESLLRGAAEALQRTGRARIAEGEGLTVIAGDRSVALRPAEEGSLADRVAPGLEALLDLDAGGGDERRQRETRALLLSGALQGLDRWSSATTGRRRSDQQVRRMGEMGAIGVRIGRREGAIRVLAVLPDSGAGAAGIVTGDQIVHVGARPVQGMAVGDVLGLLRGPAGTSVEVVLARDPATSLAVERRAIRQASVRRQQLPGGIVALRIDHFSLRTADDIRAALAEGAAPRGLILDLRGNTGGSMLGAAAVADLFLSSGVISEALDASDQPVAGLRARVEATPGGDETTPLAVLVDSRSASSSELLAAALSWHGRALLAGERTFGKVVVGKPHAFPESDLTVTITSALMRAAGRRLPAGGLEPELAMDPKGPAALERLAEELVRRTTSGT